MITVIVRCLLIYTIALLVMRLMGKRQLAQMQPFELVITLIIADLATIPMADVSIPIINGIIPLIVLAILHFTITFLSCKFLKARSFFNGRPVILVDQNGIVESALTKMNVNINDILEACRNQGYMSLGDVQFVIMETNGNISVIPNSNNTPVTREDLKIQPNEPTLHAVLISDGKYSEENLKLLSLNHKDIENFLKEQQSEVKNVLILSYSQNGQILLQIKGQQKQTFDQTLGEKQVQND